MLFPFFSSWRCFLYLPDYIWECSWPGTCQLQLCSDHWTWTLICIQTLLTVWSWGLDRQDYRYKWLVAQPPTPIDLSASLPYTCPDTHTHTPAVCKACAGQNLNSSMNTEADRPIIRCSPRSASPPLKGSRCENPVAFTQAGSVTRLRGNKMHCHLGESWQTRV